MNHNEVANALDAAIAGVAEAEYRRLSDGRSDKYVALVSSALWIRSIAFHGISPEYDEWDRPALPNLVPASSNHLGASACLAIPKGATATAHHRSGMWFVGYGDCDRTTSWRRQLAQ